MGLYDIRFRERNTNLSIGKYSGIITLKTSFDEFLSAVGIDGVLRRVHVKHIVVSEGLVLSQNHLGFARGHKCTDVASFNLFFCQLRTNPVTERDMKCTKITCPFRR